VWVAARTVKASDSTRRPATPAAHHPRREARDGHAATERTPSSEGMPAHVIESLPSHFGRLIWRLTAAGVRPKNGSVYVLSDPEPARDRPAEGSTEMDLFARC
jgi:hypothetical protein